MCLFTSAVLMFFSLALTLATFDLVVVVARFNSWDYFFLTFLKNFQCLSLRVSVTDRVSINVIGVW